MMPRSYAFHRAAELLALDLADNRYDPDETTTIVGVLLVAFHSEQRREEKDATLPQPLRERAGEPVKAAW